ncbi:hypothetical protein BAAA27536_02990 [Bifidobacterium animalis subsp. lactis ATCC 27536]|nr:hypothetical protein BAAA27536_02990 [Bifidobacterium animalis subsp. lactis ATCC 27536]KOA52865.1 hypothetical protein BAAA27674_01600 [Bifidobacterium animalis subsp. lactis ATCC 27674]
MATALIIGVGPQDRMIVLRPLSSNAGHRRSSNVSTLPSDSSMLCTSSAYLAA